MRSKYWQLVILALVSGLTAAEGQVENSPFEIQVKFQQRLKEITGPYQEKRSELIENYIGRLTELQAAYQRSSDLDNLVKAKAEIDHLKKNGKLSDQEFPGASAYRSIFTRENRAIQRQEGEAIFQLRQQFVTALEKQRDSRTRAGNVEAATAFADQIRVHQEAIAELEAAAGGKPAIKSFEIVKGPEADAILSEYDYRESGAKRGQAEASSSFPNRPATKVLRTRRPESYAEIQNTDHWALGGSAGWLKVSWASPIRAKTILLINRPVASNGDLWIKAKLSLNSHAVLEIEDFRRESIGVVELKEEIFLKELQIEILEGTHHPGLYAIEVYP